MPMVRSFASCCVVFYLLSGPVFAQPPSAAESKLRNAGIEPTAEGIKHYLTAQLAGETQKNVAKLIANLGHDDFNTRERASKDLAELVPSPIGALTAASKS